MGRGLMPNNVIEIPSNGDNVFFFWMTVLTPFHGLSKRECEVASGFLKQRHYLSQRITDEVLLNEVLMSTDTKRKIRDDVAIKEAHFQVIFSELRKKGFIIDGKINPRYIPRIPRGEKEFSLAFLFSLGNEASIVERVQEV